MYSTCPKCAYSHSAQESGLDACPGCGLVYSKWLKMIATNPDLLDVESKSSLHVESAGASLPERLLAFFLRSKPAITASETIVYAIIWLALLYWTWAFLRMDFRSAEIMNSWLHNVDLIFHEAGHVLFMPFGTYMMFLGGSLFQVLLPLIFVFAFLFTNKDGFAASVCLWWAGQSLMDLAPYIADASVLRLPLLGGGTGADSPGRHDWYNLLSPIGMLRYDTEIAAAVDLIGSGILLISMLWGGYMLFVYYRSAMA